MKQPSTRKISATLGICDDEVRLVGRRSCSLPLISSHLKLAEDFEGHDDATAIMLALHCNNIHLLGISTVSRGDVTATLAARLVLVN